MIDVLTLRLLRFTVSSLEILPNGYTLNNRTIHSLSNSVWAPPENRPDLPSSDQKKKKTKIDQTKTATREESMR